MKTYNQLNNNYYFYKNNIIENFGKNAIKRAKSMDAPNVSKVNLPNAINSVTDSSLVKRAQSMSSINPVDKKNLSNIKSDVQGIQPNFTDINKNINKNIKNAEINPNQTKNINGQSKVIPDADKILSNKKVIDKPELRKKTDTVIKNRDSFWKRHKKNYWWWYCY